PSSTGADLQQAQTAEERHKQDADLDKVIFIEPFAVGVHAAYQGDVEGKEVLVVGGGTIGNFTAQACMLAGAKKTAICDISREKIRMAE
ncbi:hypothetical protein NE639_26505, partial [Blautia producta]|nr:hypothetical protein [Blautia producta]